MIYGKNQFHFNRRDGKKINMSVLIRMRHRVWLQPLDITFNPAKLVLRLRQNYRRLIECCGYL